MKTTRRFAFCVFLLAAFAAIGHRFVTQAGGASPAGAALDTAARDSISAERIRAHVRFLAHDLLEGRGTGQRGGDIAAEYIATQFALYGLKPSGDKGTYMQKVPMVGITPGPDTRFTLVPAKG